MTPEEIQEIIELLAEKLGPMGELVWRAFITQAYLEALQWAVVIAVAVGAAIICFMWSSIELRRSHQAAKAGEVWNHLQSSYAASAKLWALLGGILLVVGIVVMPQLLMHLVNPEYFAVQKLLGR